MDPRATSEPLGACLCRAVASGRNFAFGRQGVSMTASSAGTARSRTRPRGSAGKPGTAGQLLHFARGFIKHPKMVGSIIPSSRQCISRMLRPVDWAATQVFVEYGPGVGTFTRPVLDQLAPDAKLIAIDTNPDFVAYLRREIADPRLHCVVGSAA